MSRTERSRRTVSLKQRTGEEVATILGPLVARAKRVSVAAAESRTESMIDQEIKLLQSEWVDQGRWLLNLDELVEDVKVSMRRLLKRVTDTDRL